MTREEFFGRLNRAMQGFPATEINKANEYYEEYWRDAAESGRSEEEIAASLESPEQIAARIRAECTFDTAVRQPTVKNTSKGCLVIMLAVLAAPIALPIAVAIAAVMFALVVVVIALVISLAALVISLLGSGIGMLFGGFAVPVPVGMALAGAGLVLVGLALLACVGVAALVKLIFKLCAMFFKWLFARINAPRSDISAEGES